MTVASRKSWKEIFGAEQNGMHSFNNSIFTAPYSVTGKKRNFKGSFRTGYGPVNAPKVVDTDTTGTNSGMIGTLGYGTVNDPVSYGGAGDAGSALGESVLLLHSFIESFNCNDEALTESLHNAIDVIFENVTDDAVQRTKDLVQENDVLGIEKGIDELPENYVYNPLNIDEEGTEDSIDNEDVEDELELLLQDDSDENGLNEK